MKRARFVPEARLEFLAEVVYYRNVRPELGEQFTKALEDATARALAFPYSGGRSGSNTRRVIVKGFPFTVYYRPEQDGVVVFAVAHQARRPGYWRSRTSAG